MRREKHNSWGWSSKLKELELLLMVQLKIQGFFCLATNKKSTCPFSYSYDRSNDSCHSPSRWLKFLLAIWASWCHSRKPSRASRASLLVSKWKLQAFQCHQTLHSNELLMLSILQVSTTPCLSRPSTWLDPLKKLFRRLRSWLRSTHPTNSPWKIKG